MPYPIYIILNDVYYKKKFINKAYEESFNEYYNLDYFLIKNLENKYQNIKLFITNIKNKK